MNQKSWSILIIILLAVGSGVYYFMMQTERPTRDSVESTFPEDRDSMVPAEDGVVENNLGTTVPKARDKKTYEVPDCGITFEYDPGWKVREIPGSVADNIMVVIERSRPITSSGIVNMNIPHGIKTIDEAIKEQKNKGCNGCEFREPIKSEINGIEITELYIYDVWNKRNIRPGRFFFENNGQVCSLNDEAAPDELEMVLGSVKIIK